MKKRYPELWHVLAGHQSRNLCLFGLILIPNLLAAALEGVSFAFILGGLSVFSGEKLSSIPYLQNLEGNQLFIALVLLALVCQGVRSAICGISLYANSVLSLRMQEDIQLKIYRKFLEMSYSFISQYKVGDLAEHAKAPIAMIPVIMEHANKFLVSFFMILATLSFMIILNFKLALLTFGLLTITGIIHKRIIKSIGKSSEKLSNWAVDCSKETTQMLQSIRTIHTYNRQSYVYEKIHKILDQVIRTSKKVCFWNNFIPSINELIGIFFVSSILLTGMWLLQTQQGLMLPTLITFIVLTHRLGIRLQTSNSSIGVIASHQGAISRLEEILSSKGKEFASTEGAPFPGLKKTIFFQNVTLTYPGSTKPALNRITLEIVKGSVIGIIGSSGAGKSSILDLLIRLYEPSSGNILIDGYNLKNYSMGSWRDQLGVVSQDLAIFNDTIEENIRFGLSNKTKAEITLASRAAGFHDFVQDSPQGYQTLIGERGFRLSGGQKQQLALARALLRDPEILILDEATSNLDSESEQHIQLAFDQFRGNRTVVLVAHRLSTVMNADKIYVLSKGEIVEQGTHDSLLAQNGFYTNFWRPQKEKRSFEPLLRE